jgi:hypothetical protein
MKAIAGSLAAGAMVAVLTAAVGQAVERMPAGLPPSAALLLRYDADHDNSISKEEMEAGLKADFAAADTNHDGCLSPGEVRVENEHRLERDRVQASPLVDWNLDGCVDAREFGNTVRSYFDLADRTKDGKVSQLELRGPSMPIAPRTAPSKAAGMAPDGSTTQTPTNPTTGLPY